MKRWDKNDIALNTGIGAGAEEILIPEANMGLDRLLQSLKRSKKSGKLSSIVMVAEGDKIGKNVKIEFVKDRPGHDFRYSLNSNKIKRKLKWRPKTSFDKGISKTINWYVENQRYFSKISKNLFSKRLGK